MFLPSAIHIKLANGVYFKCKLLKLVKVMHWPTKRLISNRFNVSFSVNVTSKCDIFKKRKGEARKYAEFNSYYR